jgi:hypothetical protein
MVAEEVEDSRIVRERTGGAGFVCARDVVYPKCSSYILLDIKIGLTRSGGAKEQAFRSHS